MKKVFVLAFALVLCRLPSLAAEVMPKENMPVQASNQVQWYTNYPSALAEAKKRQVPLVLFFTGSDWCGWCKKIDKEVFADPQFIQATREKFVFVKVDFPMNEMLPLDVSEQNAELKRKYGIKGYPTIVLITPQETFIAESEYRPGGGKAYADYLLSLVRS